MDLADIRKKARKAKPRSQAEGPPGPAPGAAAAPELASPPPLPALPVDPSAIRAGRTRLDALFDLPVGFQSATEEGYLEALQGEKLELDDHLRKLLTFTLGDEEYALDLGEISEIIKFRAITDVPRVPEFILGIISLRGIIVPVFDLKRRLRLGRTELGTDSRIVVCHAGDRSAGLLVDRINQVVQIPASSVEPPPTVLSGLDRELIEGIGRHQERMLILLQLGNVLNAELV
jgi:purine-binding chemotaxis protein CheW